MFLNLIHTLLVYYHIKNSPIRIPMKESKIIFFHKDRVTLSHQSIRNGPFVRALLPFPFTHRTIFITPAFKVYTHRSQFLRLHLNMYHRMKHIHPNNKSSIITTYADITIIKMQSLPKRSRSGKRVRSEPHTKPSLLQQTVILVKRTATTKVEQNIIILYPYIHTDIPTSARHGLRSIPALSIPNQIGRLSPQKLPANKY